MNKLILHIIFILLLCSQTIGQQGKISGSVIEKTNNENIPFSKVLIVENNWNYIVNENGVFTTEKLPYGTYHIIVQDFFHIAETLEVKVNTPLTKVTFKLKVKDNELQTYTVNTEREGIGAIGKMRPIEGVMIAKGKKAEIINLGKLNANLATNNARQVYARIPGLNIWESDGAGIQLGIGGRGLSPSRTANYNTRQNGYDISADALGYPETYYTPPTQAIENIQFVKGASSLQFGPQFGGLINFQLKKGAKYRNIAGTFQKNYGSFGVNTTYLDAGGSSGRWRYFGYFNHKKGSEWRPNSDYELLGAGFNIQYFFTEKSSINIELTKSNYLAHQSGGLTDLEFQNTPFISKRARNWFAVDWNLWAINFDHEFTSKTKLNIKLFGLDASRKSLGYLGQINRIDPMEERNLIVGEFKNIALESRLLKLYDIKEQAQALLFGFRLYRGYSNNKQGFANDKSYADFRFLERSDLNYSNYEFPSLNGAFFVENIFRIGKKTNIIPGLRAEYISTNANGVYNDVIYDLAGNAVFDSVYSEQLSRDRSFVIAGLAITHNIKGDSLEVYANFSQNYRSINFTDMQIVNPNLRIDPNLQDEKGFNADLGVKGLLGKALYYDLSIYGLFYNNRIGTTIMKDSLLFNTYQYRTNISKSLTVGFEGLVQVDWLRLLKSSKKDISLATYINYSYANSKYISDNELFDGNYVELVPPVNYKIGADLTLKDFSMGYQFSWMHWQYSDASNSLSQANAVNGLIPTYMVMDVSLKYKYDLLTLSTGINNLTNEIYFTRRATSYPGPGIITASPRSIYLTIGLGF